jgi:hypothetical protein
VSETLLTDKIVIKTKHGELTLDQLAEVQPGMARLMKEVGERYSILYFAAKGGNWKLAQHEVKQIVSLLKVACTLRPKYLQDITSFIEAYLNPMSETIDRENWTGFRAAFQKGIDVSNSMHEKYGYGFIRYLIPKNPPDYYDFTHE